MTFKANVEGTNLQFVSGRGYIDTVVHRMDNLSGNPYEKRFAALQHERLPKFGDPHPVIPNIFALDFNVQARGTDGATVTVVFRAPEAGARPPDEAATGLIQVGSTGLEVQTPFDRNGDRISVTARIKKQDSLGQVTEEDDTQYPEISVFRSQSILQFTREEGFANLDKARTFRNKVNSVPWLGYPRRTLLCRGVEFASNNDGQSYQVTYVFQEKDDEWTGTAKYVEEESGQLIAEPTEGNGLKTHEMYQETDFNALGLSL